MTRDRAGRVGSADPLPGGTPIRAYLLILGLVVGMPLVGLLTWRALSEGRRATREREASVAAVATNLAGNSERLFAETKSVLRKIAQQPAVRAMDPASTDPEIATFLDQADFDPLFSNIEVIDLEGRVIQSAVRAPQALDPSVAGARWFARARHSGQFVVSAPFVEPTSKRWIAMLAYPIRNESGVLAGFVALSIDLANYDRQMESLYAGPSMVVTILDSEGVVVARLPHAQRVSGQRSPEAPLALPAPAERSGTMVAAGRDGVERVYGFASIPTAGWRVYAGAPRDQVWAPVRALLLQSVLVILLVMAVVFVLGARLVSRIIGPMERLALVTDEGASSAVSRRAGLTGPWEVVRVARRFNEMLEIRERDEAAVRSSEARLSSIINSAMDAILAIDAHGTVVVFNPMAEQLFGVSSESAQGQPVGRFLMGGVSAPAASSSTAATGVNWTAVGIRANGEHFPFEATVSRVDGDRGEMTAIILRDVTERIRREAELARLNGLYAALSAVSQAAARASTRQQLLEEVCLALTEYAGFDMAWIGWQDTLAHVLVPLTVQGAEKAYLDGITIRTDDTPEGGGPLGRAIRTGQLQVSNELLTDPTMEPWRERARRHGFRSCAAFPIRKGGEVVGGLAVHSSVPQHFQRREIALLEEVASEVSFALDNLHREKRRRATEVLLRDSELRFRTLANSIPQLAWIAHADGRVHWYNDRWFDYTGTTLEEMLAGGWQKVHDPRVLPEVIRTWEEVIASGQPFQMEFPLRRRDGQFRTFLTQVLPMRDADGTLTQWFGTNTDVEDLKRAELSRRDSEMRFHAFMDAFPGLAVIRDESGRHLYVNRAFEESQGIAAGEWEGKRLEDLGIVAAELAAEIAERDRKVLRRNEPVETTDCQIDPRDPHARPHYWKSVFFPFSNNRGDRFVGTIAFEITDLVEAEVATHEARLKLQAVIENMQEGIVIFDLKGALLQSNRAAFEMQGFAPGDEPKSMTDIARDVEISTVDGRPLTAEERPQSRLMRGEPLRDMVIRLTRRDSDWCRILNLSGSIVAYEHHQSLGFITMRDITESIEATEALRHSEAKASAILSSLTEGIVVLDMNGNVVSLNAAAQRLLGRTMAEFQDPITYPRARVIRVDGTPMPLDELPSTIALKFGRGTRDVEMGVPRPDGSMAWLSSSAELIRDAAGVATGVVVSLFDITGRREADRSLRNAAERMQSLSHRLLDIQETERRQLAVELHDEIGQALTAVKINLQSLQRFPEPAALERRLEDSVSVVNRALNQVRSLSLQLRPALLDDLGLAAALRWLADQHAQRADFVLHFIDAVGDRRYAPALEIASFRIAQEAMNNVMRHADARELTVELLEEEGTLHVRIRDDGKGFDVEAARIRASGAASMGMLGMEERALLASGRIEWISNAGKGTEVHVSFPVEAAA